MRRGVCAVLALLLVLSFVSALGIDRATFTSQATATLPDLKIFLSKNFFDRNESMEIYGTLFNVTASSGVATTFTPLSGQTVSVKISNSTGLVYHYNFTTDVNGSYYSNSSFYPSATPAYAPNGAGDYVLVGVYNESASIYNSSVNFRVGNNTVDRLLLQLDQPEYSDGETIALTVIATQGTGTQASRVANVSINGTMRYPVNQTILQTFGCTTGSDGSCTVSMTAPSIISAQNFVLEANHYMGYALFSVVPFGVTVSVMDSDGKNPKDLFTTGENGVIQVRVSVNGTTPTTGNYTASIRLAYSNGTIVQTLSSVYLDTNNAFSNQSTFYASSLGDGTYLANVTITSGASSTIYRIQQASLQVRSWTLSVSKSATNSGFEYGDITLPNATLRFDAYPLNRSNGSVITGLASAFSWQLRNQLGILMSNASGSVFNTSCGSSGCYTFNLTAPATGGDYQLSVSASHASLTRTQVKHISVDRMTATATTTDSVGLAKAVFGFTEFLNMNFSARNATSAVNVTEAALIGVVYSNGTKLSYSRQANLSAMNATDGSLEWAWNTSSYRLVLDVPKVGGLYSIESHVNNQSATASARFFSNPYDTCFSAKASNTEGSSDYFWQFKPSDTIYVQLTVVQAENAAGSNTSTVTSALGSSMYGRGSACSFDSTRKQPVTNASVSLRSVTNLETGRTETLNATSSNCQSLSTQGHYLCTLAPNDTIWDSGRYEAKMQILSQDGTVSDVGNAYFEARLFYVYGYSNTWVNLPNANLSLTIRAYEAGSGWWDSSTGLSGTATISRIDYLGNSQFGGEFLSSGTSFNYNTTGLNGSTVTNGEGNLQLPANRTPTGSWPLGMYRARLQLTASDGRIDYGDFWFEVRYWDAWASPVETQSGSIQYRYSTAPNQNVSMYVRLAPAGSYSDNGGTALGGDVTIRVKKIESYGSSGVVELSASQYSSTPITVTTSSPYAGSAAYSTHILNISPTSRFPTGSYNLVLELSGTINGTAVKQQGWGWFTVKAFHASSQPVNITTGAYAYLSRGKSAVGFNVTTASDERSSYSGSFASASLINTTITGLRLSYWTGSGQQELRYPADINFTPVSVNGTSTINVSKNSGNWSSGWYWGEMTLQDNQSNQQAAYLWFGVKTFQISLSTSTYNYGPSQNFTATVSLTDPQGGSSMATSTSNYTLTRVREIKWTQSGQQTRDAVIHGNTSWNGSSRTLTIGPPSGTWAPNEWGSINLEITVKDESDNSTETYWSWMNIQSFSTALTRVSNQNIATNANATVNITLTETGASTPSVGNLSRIRYYDYSTGRYQSLSATFTVDSCSSLTSTVCIINSTGYYGNGTVFTKAVTVNVTPSGGAWPEGYTYLNFELRDGARTVYPSTNVYFNARKALTAYGYAVNSSTFQYQYSFTPNSTIGIYVYSIQDANSVSVQVNVTNVQHYAGYEYRESLRTYTNVSSWSVHNNATAQLRGSGGYLNASAPSSGWPTGTNYLRLSIQKTGGSSADNGTAIIYYWVNSAS